MRGTGPERRTSEFQKREGETNNIKNIKGMTD
jgi:hypothetical protein